MRTHVYPSPTLTDLRTEPRLAATLPMLSVAFLLLMAGAAPGSVRDGPTNTQHGVWRSPLEVAFSPDGSLLAVSDPTAGRVAFIRRGNPEKLQEAVIPGQPMDLGWSADGNSIWVVEHRTGDLVQVDAHTGRSQRRLPAGPKPTGLAVAARRGLLIVSATDVVSVIALDDGKIRARVRLPREAQSVAVTPDESLAVVAGFLPAGPASEPDTAAVVSLIDLDRPTRKANIALPAGSTTVRGLDVSPDGRWAYVVHTVGRFNVPTTQIERGWINTNALSLIDLVRREHFATVLLDDIASGAADPWGMVVSRDGTTLWVSLSGVHEVARVDLAGLHDLLEGKLEGRPWLSKSGRRALGTTSIWQEIRDDPKQRARLADEPGALYAARLVTRAAVPGKGPRGLALRPDGGQLAVAIYFSGEVALLDPKTMEVNTTLTLGYALPPDTIRQGEIAFHDATLCHQQWMSCATCHPDGRVDGLNWDLLNDGINSPKNTKSLLWAHKTPPAMSLGVRASMEVASAAGFRHILFREPKPEVLEATQAYIRSLQPELSPYRTADGSLSKSAERGRAVFENPATGCSHCHPAPLFTNLNSYDVGTAGSIDTSARFDTPTLVELWLTASYLHDGSAANLQDVLKKHNQNDRHGVTSHLSKEQIEDLIMYLLSL